MTSHNSFLEVLSPEVEDLLTWFRGSADSEPAPVNTEKFAGGFLFQVLNDGALVPIIKMQPAKLLGMVLTHHEKAPHDPVGWLNLGFTYRRIALYRPSDPRRVDDAHAQAGANLVSRAPKQTAVPRERVSAPRSRSDQTSTGPTTETGRQVGIPDCPATAN
jgi:hypothetical protein